MRLASAKRFDWFGAYVVGLVTAIGGGTTRDLLLDVTPFWMLQPSYLIVTGFALLFVIFLGKWVIRLHNTFFIFDAIGLGLFVVVGIDKALELNYPFWVAILVAQKECNMLSTIKRLTTHFNERMIQRFSQDDLPLLEKTIEKAIAKATPGEKLKYSATC